METVRPIIRGVITIVILATGLAMTHSVILAEHERLVRIDQELDKARDSYDRLQQLRGCP